MEALDSPWPFAVPPNVVTITTVNILERSYSILLVMHDEEDGCWQVLCGTTSETTDARVAGLGEMYKRDPSIGRLADLPRGWRAWRKSVNSPWQRETSTLAKFQMSGGNRQLTDHERRLVRWMLEHGEPGAMEFLSQLDMAEVTPWKCPCGCASINFQIRGRPHAPPGVHPIASFVWDEGEMLKGIFVYQNDGILSGLEVWAIGDAPESLPQPEELRTADARR